jgi:SulP family sulfate permease
MKSFFNHFVGDPKADLLSGLTVALALVPEAVAFAFVAGVDPLVGLYGAFMMCLITSLFGGRPGMISGATGAMAVVMVHLIQAGNQIGAELGVERLGLSWLLITLLFVGVLQIGAGVLKLGKFVRLIPHPVMMGFVNGLAIVIFLSQLGMFTRVSEGQTVWLQGAELMTMIGLVGATMLIMWLLPKLTQVVPAALTAILVVAGITIGADLDVTTVGSFIRDGGGEGLKGGLPTLQTHLIGVLSTLEGHWGLVLSTAGLLAAVGLIESLMTLNLVDDLTETRGSGNRECVAQGSANLINGLFGGMGGCAMIGQSIINVNSGGRGRLSGLTAAVGLLSFVLFGAPLIEQIPIAALVGVMFMVVIGTFAWSSFKMIRKIPTSDAVVLIAVSAITVWQDLAIAVVAGVIMSALKFAWENAVRIRARKRLKEDGTKIYEIWGPLFFGSVQTFATKFDVKSDPQKVEIDFMESRVSDHSGIEALKRVIERYLEVGKEVTLTHLSPECKALLTKAHPGFDKYIESSVEDPRYHVVTDLMDAEV